LGGVGLIFFIKLIRAAMRSMQQQPQPKPQPQQNNNHATTTLPQLGLNRS
jgi:hypothetical protein